MKVKEKQKFYIETYGCQMNFSDTEVVNALMQKEGYILTENIQEANIIMVNTCSIRENAEQRVWGRLDVFRLEKNNRKNILVGVIGCMAERLKDELLEGKIVDFVIGPDAYRDLPSLLKIAESGEKAINVILSKKETYDDLSPVRMDNNNVSAFVSVMRGCNNMCSYCIVPYTRGVERSRDPKTIIREIQELKDSSYKEVTLLGQNVDSYKWTENNKVISFSGLLEAVAVAFPDIRIRFATSHPKDMSDEALKVMALYENICKNIHLPAQSGSSAILSKMKRGYDAEWYRGRIEAIRNYIPEADISTDIIAGFCSETEEDHIATIELMKWAKFDFAYMFKYSERPKTLAGRKYKDDVPEDVKSRRLSEIISLQNELSAQSHKEEVGKTLEVLVEGLSKKSNNDLSGRSSNNKVVVFPKENYKVGDFVNVKITRCTAGTLIGEAESKA